MDKKNSGVGVLDKAVKILATLESGPHSLSELVAATGIARPTAHRLAVALEFHRLVSRDLMGRFVLGARSSELAAAAGEDHAGIVILQRGLHSGDSLAHIFGRSGSQHIPGRDIAEQGDLRADPFAHLLNRMVEGEIEKYGAFRCGARAAFPENQSRR